MLSELKFQLMVIYGSCVCVCVCVCCFVVFLLGERGQTGNISPQVNCATNHHHPGARQLRHVATPPPPKARSDSSGMSTGVLMKEG